jgi:hypothetical protein
MSETFEFKHYLTRGENEITVYVVYVYHHAEKGDNITPDSSEDIEIFETLDYLRDDITLTDDEMGEVIDAAWDHLKYEVQ